MKIQVAVLSCLLAGCAASQSGAPSTSPPQLEGTSWSLATATDSNGVIAALVNKPGKPLTVQFEGNRLGVRETCNVLNGQYTLTGNTLKIGQMISTMMACEPALMQADREISLQLEGNSKVEMAGAQLVLKTEKGGTLSFDRN